MMHSKPAARSYGFALAILSVVAMALGWPHAAQAAPPSTVCPTMNLTVTRGGSVQIDDACDTGFGIGFSLFQQATHGTAVIVEAGGGGQIPTIRYDHNGADPATTDSFVYDDGSAKEVLVNLTIEDATGPLPLNIDPNDLPTIFAGAPYSQQLSASGGTGTITYALKSGTLPVGITLSAGGLISGTTNSRFDVLFTIEATDSTGLTGEITYSEDVEGDTLTLSPNPPPDGFLNHPYSVTFSSGGGVAPRTVVLASGSLPPGLSLGGSNGHTLSGTPTALGSYTFQLNVEDSSAGNGTQFTAHSVTLDINAQPTITVTPATLADGTVGATYNQTVSGSGGTAPYTFAVSAGSLPAGLSLAADGSLTGVPTAGGNFVFTVTATDSSGFAGARAYNLTVAAADIVLSSGLASTNVGVAYADSITASGGTAPYSYAVTAGSLPAGLTLDAATGAIAGTATAGGIFNFTVTATDSSTGAGPYSDSLGYELVVYSPTMTLTPAVLLDGLVGAAYSQTFNTSGGTAPYSYAVTSGSLPPGLSLTAGGVLSGTPTAAGTFNFTFYVSDSSTGGGPYAIPGVYEVIIASAAPIANPVSATVAYGSGANPITLNISGGTPTSVTVVTAPAHGTASASGTTISYQPSAGYAGPDSFSYTASNADGTSAPATVTITVADPVITVTASAPLTTQVGEAYSQTFTWSGGAAPYSGYAVTGLPAGLAVSASDNDSVTVSGTPTEAGSFTVNASAIDTSTGNGSFTKAEDFTLQVNTPSLSMSPAPGPTLQAPYAQSYSQTFTVSGGTAPYTYTLNGTLPTGLSFDASTGTLSGTPTQIGFFQPLEIKATDSSTGTTAPYEIAYNYQLHVSPDLDPSALPNAVAGVAYDQQVTTTGGIAPYTYSMNIGTSLPPGLSLASDGRITGAPTTSGSFNFNIQSTDSNGISGARGYMFTVAVPTLTVTPASLPDATAGFAYSQAITVSGGIAPYSYAITAGALPPGITLDTSGATAALTGTPSASGSYSFDLQVTDSTAGTAATATLSYSLLINAPTIMLTPATLPGGVVGTAYTQTLSASGGTAPYAFSVTVGSLPPGVSLASDGTLLGIPTASGTSAFTVEARGAYNQPGSHSYSITVGEAAPVAGNVSATVAYGSGASPITLNISGGTPTSVTVVTAPAHGTASASGTTISYQPSAGYAGPDSFSYTASNADGTSAPATVTITVSDPVISVTASAPLTAQVGTAYSQTFTWSGGAAPYSGYAVTGLPAGLAVSASDTDSVTVSGTPTQAGSFTVNAPATDASTGNGPFTKAQNFTLQVNTPSLSMSPAPGTLDAPYAQSYSQTFTASGGTAPYTYTLNGTLPAGLSFNVATGTLSGTPTEDGFFDPITVTATDTSTGTGAPYQVSHDYDILVLTDLDPSPLPNAVAGVAYDEQVTTTGGIAPYTYSMNIGTSLPPGLSLASNGHITGTPTASGSFNFNIKATDSNGIIGARGYMFTVGVPTLSISDTTAAEGTPAQFTVSLSAPSATDVTVVLDTSDGTATASADYTAQTGLVVTIPAGSTSAIVAVPTVDDALFEGDETFSATLSAPSGATLGDAVAVATINDDIPLTATISDTTAAEGTPAQFTVSLSAPSATDVTVVLDTSDGTATASADYTAQTGLVVTIPAGSTSATVAVPTVDDAVFEGDETFSATLSAPTGATLGDATAAGTITENDAAPTVSISDTIAAEGTPAQFTVSLSAPNATDITVVLDTSDGTATASADYTVQTGLIVIIPAGSTSAIVAVPTIDDAVFEGDETFSATLSAPSGATLGDAFAVATINDDDAPLTATISGTPTMTEGGSLVYTVHLDRASPVDTVINLALSGTATAGSDYTAPSAQIVLPGGVITGNLALSTLDDGVYEGAETVLVELQPGTGYAVGTPATASGTINDAQQLVVATPDSGIYRGASGGVGVANVLANDTLGGNPATLAEVVLSQVATSDPALGLDIPTGAVNVGPASGGIYTLSYRICEASSPANCATAVVTITVVGPVTTVTASAPLTAQVGVAYSQTFTWSGGIAPYSGYAVTGLPAGLAVTASDTDSVTVSGTPTEAGSFTVNASAADNSTGNGPFTTAQDFNLQVNAPGLIMSPAAGTLNVDYAQSYSQGFTASGGTAPYRYALTGTLPTGLSFDGATGTLSGTATQTGSFPVTVTVTDSSSGAGAPFSVANNYTFEVAAPTITLTPATLPAGIAGAAYSQTITAGGGLGSYTFAVTAGALPAGMSLASDGALSGSPTASGAFNLTVTATDGNGQTGSRAYALTIATATLSVTPTTVPAGTVGVAYSQTFNTSGGVAPYTYTLSSGALPPGMGLSSTGLLSGTPTTTGTFGFDLQVTDSTGDTAATATLSYSLVINAPTITLTPATLSGGVVGTAYAQTLSASGGTAPYAFSVTAGSLPAGVSLDSDGTLSGAPTASGTFAFTVEARGAYNQTGSHNYSITVDEAVPVAVDDTASTIAEQAVSISVTDNDSGVIDAIVIDTPPAHGAVSIAGLEAVYTSTVGFSGNDSFTYTANGPGGVSVAATVTVAVTALPAPVGQPQQLSTLAGEAVSFDVATDASGGPFTGVTVTAPPAEGTVTIDGTMITYTPPLTASGAVEIGYTLSNAYGASAPITTTITVNPMPMAPAHHAQVLAGSSVAVELTTGASGGPFTAAQVLSISPATAGNAEVVDTGEGGYRLDFAAAIDFAGPATLRYTLSNAHATSVPAEVTIEVMARPDPSQDPEVTGLLRAQVQSTRRLARGQINNFQQRLERLHDGRDASAGFDNGLSVAIQRTCDERDWQSIGNSCPRQLGDEQAPVRAPDAKVGNRNAANPLFGIWTSGSMRFGEYDQQRGYSGFEFETSGVSLGADYHLSPDFALGGGFGYGRDVSDIGKHDSRSEADAWSAAIYASYHPGEHFYLDGLLGYQWMSFQLRRHVTATGGQVFGERDGQQWFVSLAAGYQYQNGQWGFVPYARLDVTRATLDGYVETGDPLYALAFADQDIDTSVTSLGMRLDYLFERDWGTFAPQLRLEYQHDLDADSLATMHYADLLSGPFYHANIGGFDRNRFVIGLGAAWRTDRNLGVRLEYGSVFGNSGADDQSLRLNIEKQY